MVNFDMAALDGRFEETGGDNIGVIYAIGERNLRSRGETETTVGIELT